MDSTDTFEPTEELVNGYSVVRSPATRIPAWSGSVTCDLVIVWKDSTMVVVVSQREDYSGVSITNAIEDIATFVKQAIPADATVRWFEHYPVGRGIVANRYSLMEVSFAQGQPSWGRLANWEEIAADTGVPAALLASGYEQELAPQAELAEA